MCHTKKQEQQEQTTLLARLAGLAIALIII
jgi:hypothetical protein